jgi:glycosyltransferase involved in cell wall biosynthesis
VEIRREIAVNILLVNYEFPPIGGGAANATWSIARELTRDGHTVSVLTSALGELKGYAEEDGMRVYRVQALRKSRDRSNVLQMLAFAVAAAFAARRIATASQPKACVAFFTIPSGPVALLLKRQLGIRYVISIRGGDAPGYLPELDWYHRLLRPLRRSILGNANAIVANSRFLGGLSTGADPFPVRVIPNGVDGEFFSPPAATGRAANEPFKFLYVGRFRSEKNLGSLLDELAALSASTAKPFVLELAGDGPQREDLARQAVRLGLSERLKWHGWVSKEALRELYGGADALVHPSFVEGMSNTILEAMACGLPVIASDIDGNEDLVIAGETGQLFPLSEPGSLATAMADFLENPRKAREMGAAGRKRALAEFSWQKTARSYLELATGLSATADRRGVS